MAGTAREVTFELSLRELAARALASARLVPLGQPFTFRVWELAPGTLGMELGVGARSVSCWFNRGDEAGTVARLTAMLLGLPVPGTLDVDG